ncbi:PAS domain S-box protein [Proteobacteria bacterium 005FR1]|nr:PAS domain S-box protein [Proteobacteria bacterium 005FR1]
MSNQNYRRQLEAICNNASVALFIMDDRQHCTYMNAAAIELTGYAFEEVQGRPLHDVIHHTRPDGSHYPLEECPIDRAFPQNNQEQGEDVFVHKDGHFYDVSFTASPIREGDRTIGTVVEVQDITDRKRRESNQAFLTEIADQLALLTNEDRIIARVGESLGRFLNIDSCFYAQIDTDEDTASINYLWRSGNQRDVTGEHRLADFVSDDFQRAAQSGEIFVVSDTNSDPRTYRKAHAAFGIRAYITVPYHHHGRWRYLLTVASTRPREWREDEADLMKDLASRLFPRLERARTEAVRRDSEERYRLIARATNDVIWDWDLTSDRLEWNEAVIDHLGCTPQELGPSIEGWYSRIHPDDRDRVVGGIHAAIEGGENSWRDEYRFRKSSGAYVHFVDRGYIARDREGRACRMIGAMFDLSERKQAELERVRLHALVENSSDFIGIADAEGNPIFVNPAGRKMVGLEPDAPVRGLTIEDFYPPDQWPLVRNTVVPALLKGGRWTGDTYFQHFKTGEPIPVSDTHFAFVHPESGELIGHATITRDISERQRSEAALRENDRRKDEFLAMLAHELRNPLAAISNTVELLQRKIDDAQLLEWTDILHRQSGKLGGMVDDLLDVSRVTRGMISLKRERADLLQIVSSALQSVQGLMDEKDHRVTTSLSEEAVEVDGDPVRLEQIVVNLLTNAAKYTDAGGYIDVALRCDAGRAELRVRDNGIGLGAETLARVFDLFGQAERGLARSEGGLGIGLTIVKRLVELHGGTIHAQSAGLGTGAEFIVSLPLADNQRVPDSIAEAKPLCADEDSKRVLIVEDNPDIADTMALLIEAAGHEVSVAEDGPSALLAAEDFGPDVVLLDIGLPGMDGYEVARRLRRSPGTRQAVLAALTGYGQARDRERTEAAGFDAHFVKPVDLSALEAFIRQAKTTVRNSAAS